MLHQDNGTVVATEQTASQGRFELTIAGGTLAGTWADKDRRKSLPGVQWGGAERRLPPNERLRGSVPAAA